LEQEFTYDIPLLGERHSIVVGSASNPGRGNTWASATLLRQEAVKTFFGFSGDFFALSHFALGYYNSGTQFYVKFPTNFAQFCGKPFSPIVCLRGRLNGVFEKWGYH
jgi:hypothetical protein